MIPYCTNDREALLANAFVQGEHLADGDRPFGLCAARTHRWIKRYSAKGWALADRPSTAGDLASLSNNYFFFARELVSLSSSLLWNRSMHFAVLNSEFNDPPYFLLAYCSASFLSAS